MWKILIGLLAIAATFNLEVLAQEQFHDLRFFLSPDLVAGMDTEQLRSRISQYAADINFVFGKQTNRRFLFDPQTNITITDTQPHTNTYSGSLPETGYELWVHAVLTDKPSSGTYGGHVGTDESGAGVAAGLKWDAVHDPSTLADGSEALKQYWTQIDHVVHEFEHVFGAGLSEYYGLSMVDDTTGVAPVVDIRQHRSNPYWGHRQDYFADPLLNNIYDLDLVGAPTSLTDLRSTVRFADVTVAVVDRGPRQYSSLLATVPDLSSVIVEVLDDRTGVPISDATVRVWTVESFAPYEATELSVSPAGSPGAFQFSWDAYPFGVFTAGHHLTLIKAYTDRHAGTATWVSIFDAQQEKLIAGHDQMVVSLRLVPEPSTLVLTALGLLGVALWGLRRKR